MIPGFVAGHYSFEECHIDLARLCARSGARLVHAEATGIDRAGRQVLLKDQPALAYDLLSIDVGSAPNVGAIAGAEQWAIPVKPIAELGRRWLEFSERMKSWLGPLNVMVIGGGAGGVELALAIDHRLREVAKARQPAGHARHQGRDPGRPGRGGAPQAARDLPAPRHPAARARRRRAHRARRGAARGRPMAAGRRGVRRHRGECRAVVRRHRPAARREAAFSPSTTRSPRPAIARIFAAGDCATVLDHRRPKAGVFAVRQGPPLADNLRRVLRRRGGRSRSCRRRRYLSILGTGDGRAVATRGAWAIEGRWVWWWKDHIDRKWMRMYRWPYRNLGDDFRVDRVRITQGRSDRWRRTRSSTRSRTPSCAPRLRSCGPAGRRCRPSIAASTPASARSPARRRWRRRPPSKAVSRTKRAVRKVARKATGKAAKKAARRGRRR